MGAFEEEDEATVMVPTFGAGAFFADRYRIDALLGSGAMGRVYSAVELHNGRKVALKVLHKERLGEEETVERFRREAEVLASIGHPCIVQVYAFHHDSDGTPYLAMEMLEGVTLKTRLTNVGRFDDPRDFQEILDGICGALSAAHARGIVHRDMKPDNIFLLATGDPRAKVVDFGLSRIAASKNKSLTHSGMILGTPRYMAPEQIRNAASAGPAVDIYSVGVVAFEALTGQSPYPAQDYGQLLGCVLESRITPLEQLRPDLPRALGAVLKRAMDADPATRFASCDELADAYGAAIGSPSRRKEIAAKGAARVDPPRQRRASVSSQSLQASKGSTLALDLSAAREQLPGLPESTPPPPMETSSYSDATTNDMFGAGYQSYPDQQYSPAPQQQYPLPPADPSASMGGYAPPAKGGDTLFIPQIQSSRPGAPDGGLPPGQGGALPLPPPPAMPSYPATQQRPALNPQHAAAAFSANAVAPAPPKKKGRGMLLFFVALVLVVILAGLGGFAAREYIRGGGELPSWVPRPERGPGATS